MWAHVGGGGGGGVETRRELMSTYVNKAAGRAAANIKVIHNR